MIWFKSRKNLILRLTILLLCVGLISFYEVLERVDNIFYDTVSSMHQYSPGTNVVIVEIDEESMQALGYWPWSRKIHAEFINRLAHRDNVIALDLLFLEHDENDPSADSELGAAIVTHGSVILPVVPLIDAHMKTLSLAEQLPFLRENVILGHADIELDYDGVARRVFLAAGIDAPKWPALGLALASQANVLSTINLPTIISDAKTSMKGSWVRSHEVLIPYVGPPGSFQKISYAQILHDDALVASLNGKTIIVGVTAAGMGTLLATPVSPINRQPMSGVEWHANVYDMLLHNRAILPASNIASSLISVFLLLVILLSIHLMRLDYTIPILLVLFACSLLIIGLSFRWLNIWIPPSAALFGLVAIYPLWNWQRVNEFMRALVVVDVRSDEALKSIREGVIANAVVNLENHDALTKLPGRALLLSRFDQMTITDKNTDIIVTVLFVKLDNLKKVNDVLGHRVGDILLKIISRRLLEAVREDDIVARWSGDEFVLLFDYLQKKETAQQMAQIILEAIRLPYEINGENVFVTASVGICFYPQDGERCEEVLEKAGAATFRVKFEGGNSFGFYSSELSVGWAHDRLKFEKELRASLRNSDLQVLYQPIVDVPLSRIVQIEAFIRWQHPTRGFLSPCDFMPLAEDIGLTNQIGEFVLRTACIAAYKLEQTGRSIKVSVNVNSHQLLNGNFKKIVCQVLSDTGLSARLLILEVTENAIVSDITRAVEVLNEIKTVGVSIALDDFGTSYSSLTLLRKLPIDILKIDKYFIRTMGEDINDLKTILAIIGLGKNLGISTIAEGVETKQQIQMLIDYHCYMQQGFCFSRPVSYEAVAELLNEPDKFRPTLIS